MVTIFGASCRYQFWGFVLDRLGGFKIQMSLTEDFVVSCLPVCDLSGFETLGFVKREFRVSETRVSKRSTVFRETQGGGIPP